MAADTIAIEYSLKLDDGELKRHVVHLDSATMALKNPEPATRPDWTRLEFHRCPNCPLDPAANSHCPVAVGLVNVIESFKHDRSHDMAEVTVQTPHRAYTSSVSLQAVASSIMGLHMATSGCPILDKLRPMAYTHLPFATIEETLYRALSMYLLAQYLRWKTGLEPDWELDDLIATYTAVGMVNVAFGQRILNINTKDANLNALVSLDCFAGMTSPSALLDYLREIEPYFSAHMDEDDARRARPSAA